MKLRAIIGIVALTPTVLLSGCDNIFGLDNYDEPDSMLSGRVVYDGQPVNVRSGGIELEAWEEGYEQPSKIPVYVAQDGTFSASLFAGDYKLNAIRGQGPWVATDDTLRFPVSGETTRDFPVTPYFLVAPNPQFVHVAPSGVGADTLEIVRATFSINTVVPSTDARFRQLESVGLYVGKTAIVDQTNREVFFERTRAQLPADWQTAPVTLSVNLPKNIRLTPSPVPRTHVQARIGIKIVGIAERIFSPVVEVTLP